MSDGNPSDFGSGSPVGRTSAEAVPSQSASERLRQGLSAGLTIYEVMLLFSLIFVTLACVQMFRNTNEYGSFPFANPYKVDSVRIGATATE